MGSCVRSLHQLYNISMQLPRRPKRFVFLCLLLGVILVAIGMGVLWFSKGNTTVITQALPRLLQKQEFPVIATAGTTSYQQKIAALLKQEYTAQPPATKYSQGVKEAWCADFVSWILNEAGAPLVNPHSGSWRIPGVYTLREYYQANGTFKAAATGYQPKLGDVVLYEEPGIFGSHTNIVIANNNGILTTVGGNEPGGIRVFTNTQPEKAHIVGYGVL